jgi:RNA polymerase-binding transcription factor DksA
MKPLSDEQLRQVRAQLIHRRDELHDRIRRVTEDLQRVRAPLPRDSEDAAIAVENDEVLEAVGSTATAELAHVGHALGRVNAGTFGSCEACGKAIAPERLGIIPYATRCSACESPRSFRPEV